MCIRRETRNSQNIPFFNVRHNYFKNSFFPSAIIEWNKLDDSIRNSSSFILFKRSILSFIRPISNSIFNIHNPIGIKHLTRIRLGFSHLKEHKFRHNFKDSIDPFCSCGSGVETTSHFFLHCANFVIQRQTLKNQLDKIDDSLLKGSDTAIVNSLLYGKPNFEDAVNKEILNSTIEFIMETGRFSSPLF